MVLQFVFSHKERTGSEKNYRLALHILLSWWTPDLREGESVIRCQRIHLSPTISHCCTCSLSPNLTRFLYAIHSFPRALSDLFLLHSSDMSGTFSVTGTELRADPGQWELLFWQQTLQRWAKLCLHLLLPTPQFLKLPLNFIWLIINSTN